MRRRLIIVNVFFAPRSFGGATIVAEEMASRLSEKWDILVVTTIDDPDIHPYTTRRYKAKNIDIIGIRIPPDKNKLDEYINPYFAAEFSLILKAFNPNAVHVHCIQNMGAELLEACRVANIPSVVTIHDHWWICPRQFMVNNHNTYCWNERIDLNVCEACTSGLDSSPFSYSSATGRYDYLTNKLALPDLLLFPSAYQKGLYKDKIETDKTKLVVNKNGIQLPGHNFKKAMGSGVVRFCFVGGIGAIKGFEQIKSAFRKIENADYELVLVDNTMNLGHSTMRIDPDQYTGTVKVVPAYTQESMDDFYSKVDVLLFPSQWKESFGLTVREALARDVWVIATESGGVVEDIVDGENGTIIPLDGDYTSLKQEVEILINKSFDGYVNPHKDQIVSFDDQAAELDSILSGLTN